ncbi:MAG TPA: DUF1510 domain-containing protein [Bacillus bacterium]|uniref:DUF1510 domain-containing protein n=1 Tax=Siminovitchia fordii TaxID=254759 RepID=A0ABQ4K2U6_9BACI|nr:DUF1510 family protein [Siminovitchia fordii]GIN20086.1 hypothetical protein J1TS3_12200 [Siminovitchia fordii]HBZ09165.1 DUF1510 domain-containing protein [Bacillus sp. (in: firmicutes)]
MPIDFKDDKSRSALRAKRRKTNIVLNTLIAVVIILILLVGGTIFFGGSDTGEEQAKRPQNTEKEITNKPADKSDETDDNSKEDTPDEEEEDENGKLEEIESDEPNVEKVLINPAWKPIGTEQGDGHQSSYNMGTTDWNEKLKAAAYAVDIPVENMTTWWVTGGDDPDNQAELTVSAKNSDDTYRVNIEWVTGEGWKPVEVKKLIQNDKR